MNHDEFERLADAAFDDRIGTQDRERLEALVAGDPGLRSRWDDLCAARTALAGAGLEPLPAGLHEALIGELRSAAPRGGQRLSWLSFFTAAIQTRPVFALGGAVAAGLAIGVIGFGLIMGGLRAGRDLASGTTASLPAAVAATTLELGGDTRVEMTSRREEGAIIVRLDARGTAPATVALDWDPAALRLIGARWGAGDAPGFGPAPGRVTLHVPAAGSELSFAEIVSDGSALRVTLSAAGTSREVTLRLPR